MRLLFAAVHESVYGTSRHFAVVPNDGRDRSEADMPRASGERVDLTKMTQNQHQACKC